MIHVGVDGCPCGWYAVRRTPETTTGQLYSSLEELWANNNDAERILIDIPIGLPNHNDSNHARRSCDIEAREQLGPRRSSVFFTPIRAVLDAESQAVASERSKDLTSRGVSIQAFYLFKKIREMDQLYGKYLEESETVHESHPELCFAKFNGDEPLASKKSTKQGRNERLEIISQVFGDARDLYDEFRDAYLVREVGHDDILDAMVLAAAAAGETATLPAEPERDAEGRPMQMVYPVLA